MTFSHLVLHAYNFDSKHLLKLSMRSAGVALSGKSEESLTQGGRSVRSEKFRTGGSVNPTKTSNVLQKKIPPKLSMKIYLVVTGFHFFISLGTLKMSFPDFRQFRDIIITARNEVGAR